MKSRSTCGWLLAVGAGVAGGEGLGRVRVPVGRVGSIPGVGTRGRRSWEAYCGNVEVDRRRYRFYRKIIVVE